MKSRPGKPNSTNLAIPYRNINSQTQKYNQQKTHKDKFIRENHHGSALAKYYKLKG
jgi:hypothetical protein